MQTICPTCHVTVKSCGCHGARKLCDCGFTESSIKEILRQQRLANAIEDAKARGAENIDEPQLLLHSFPDRGKWNKCEYCGTYRFYGEGQQCPVLLEQVST